MGNLGQYFTKTIELAKKYDIYQYGFKKRFKSLSSIFLSHIWLLKIILPLEMMNTFKTMLIKE